MSETGSVTDPARVAAFHRLGLPTTARGPAFAHLVALLRQVTGAATVTLAFVDDSRAWLTVGVAPLAPVPLRASPAVDALEHPEVVWQRPVHGKVLDDHPALARLARPLTVTTVRVAAPDGHPVGALELAWPDGEEPSPLAPAVLERFAEHVRELLELHAEVDEYRRFVELAPDPMVVLDREGRIARVNPALTSFVGLTGEDLLGRAFLDLVHRADRASAAAAVTRALINPQRTTRMELRLTVADGRTLHCAVSAGHLGGALRHVQLVLHDLTDRLRVEEEQSRLSEQLARAERLDAIGEVAAGLAHDLNNLLGVMSTNLSLAEESLGLAVDGEAGPAALQELSADLGELRTAIGRATSMTGEMLAFGAASGREATPVDVVDVIYGVGRLVGRSMPAGVRFALDVPGELPLVSGDAHDLERALMNLVLNARDAVLAATDATSTTDPTDPAEVRGSVLIRARHAHAHGHDRAHVHDNDHDHDHGDNIEVQVIDDGAGMDPGTQARAREPLFTTKGDDGSGMGLATVAAYASTVGGALNLESAPGAGTTVTLQLPVAAEADADRSVLPVSREVPVAGERVLLVDPGERTRRVIDRMLSAAGYRVSAVTTLHEAREVLAEGAVGLLLTELALPDGRGDRLVELAREERPGLPAVVLGVEDGPAHVGAVPVLVKPFSHVRLLRTVQEALADGG